MARKTKEETEKTYHALLDAAQIVFVKQGVAKTTLNHIAKQAGMTRGALYWHFENKDALILALWEEHAGTLNKNMTNALTNLDKEKPAKAFRRIMQNTLQTILDDPKLSQALKIIMYCVEITDEKTPLYNYLQEKHKSYFDSMLIALMLLKEKGVIKVELSPITLTSGLLAYIYGLVHMHLEPEPLINLQRDGIALIDFYMDGFLTKEG